MLPKKSKRLLVILSLVSLLIFGLFFQVLGSSNAQKAFAFQASKTPSTLTDTHITQQDLTTPPPVIPTNPPDLPISTTAPSQPTAIPTLDRTTVNPILGNVDNPGDDCILSTFNNISINVHEKPSLQAKSIGWLSVYRTYRVIEIYQDYNDIWYRIEGNESQPEIDKGWVAGTLNNDTSLQHGTFTIVLGRCDRLINLDEVLKDCPEIISQIRALPPYIEFAYAASANPCDSFQRLLQSMRNDRHFGDNIRDYIRHLFEQCPLRLAVLYIKLKSGQIPFARDFVCQVAQTQTPIPTSENESTPELGTTIPPSTLEVKLDVVGAFVEYEANRPEISEIHLISDQGIDSLLLNANDNTSKRYPVLDPIHKYLYYISVSNNIATLQQYELEDSLILPKFVDQQTQYQLQIGPFAITDDGGLLVVLKDTNGTTVYRLDTTRVASEQTIGDPLLKGVNDIVSVSLSPDNNFMAVVRQNTNKQIYVYNYQDLTQPPILIGNSDLLNQNCFDPAFATNSVALYFICDNGQAFVQRDINIDEPDQIFIEENGGLISMDTIKYIAPIGYDLITYGDNQAIYLARFPGEDSINLEYNHAQTSGKLIQVLEGWLATDITWASTTSQLNTIP